MSEKAKVREKAILRSCLVTIETNIPWQTSSENVGMRSIRDIQDFCAGKILIVLSALLSRQYTEISETSIKLGKITCVFLNFGFMFIHQKIKS